MELFSEVYGCYYQVVAEILRAAPLLRNELDALVARQGYGESALHLIPKLMGGGWPLLDERDGLLCSRLSGAPVLPITALEQAWLKSLLGDPRIRLFLTDPQLEHLNETLAQVEPLYRQSDLIYLDRYLDGDNYNDPGYRARFQALLAAMKDERFLHLTYAPPRGRTQTAYHRPLRLEYSPKDDKFRVYTAKAWHGRFQDYYILNLSRILEVEPSQEYCKQPLDLEAWRKKRRCVQPLLLQVTRERNGIERFMVEFSAYEKHSEYDDEMGICTVRLWYQRDDETEVLIRLLGFGPVVRVLEPEPFVAQMRERVRRQQELLWGSK